MMRRFRSLLIDRAHIRLPGLNILSFAVHRHLPEHASVEPHRHPWSQALLYLSGNGRQFLAKREAHVRPGTLVVLPSRVGHAFSRMAGRAPLCLMIDFHLQGAGGQAPVVCNLTRWELAQIRQQLARLRNFRAGAGHALRWEGAVTILQMLITLLRAVGWIEALPASTSDRSRRALLEMLAKMDYADSLAAVVQRSGYQRDHLNRLIKKATGLTLGQYRAQRRLAKAKELLAQGLQVAAVGAAVSVPDPSYFARWFHRQTGQRPSTWNQRGLG